MYKITNFPSFSDHFENWYFFMEKLCATLKYDRWHSDGVMNYCTEQNNDCLDK